MGKKLCSHNYCQISPSNTQRILNMGNSVLVFVSHSSQDKETLVEPIVNDLGSCYINVWIDKHNIVPGDNLRKSIFRNGLDKADVVLIFFTQKSLQSAWVDSEIKHVLREEKKKGNNFDLNKIISIFDSKETYDVIQERYPELTDDLLHLMPENYTKVQLGQLISAIWSKYLSLQGGDVETQRQLLEKDKEIFQKDKEIQSIQTELEKVKSGQGYKDKYDEFQRMLDSGYINDLVENRAEILSQPVIDPNNIKNIDAARAFGFVDSHSKDRYSLEITEKGRDFFQWYLLEKNKVKNTE